MERLTRRYDTHIAVVCENCDKQFECNGGVICGEVLRNRLAAYEDAMPLERAQELAQAERGGRLVVLPDVKYTDADGEKALQKAMWTCGNRNNPVTRYTADAIAEKLCREAKEDNPPLTLEELREMGLFDWLWIEVVCPSRRQVFRKIESAYYQVFEDYTDGDALCCGWPGLIHEFEYEDYGKTWQAYRRKPEEV